MDGEFAAFLFMSSMVITIGGLLFFHLLTRHRERTQMIEKGADASMFQAKPRQKNYFFAMLLGILFISMSVGIGLGFLVNRVLLNMERSGSLRHYNDDNPGPYFFGIFLMLGVGFIVAFFLNKKLLKEES